MLITTRKRARLFVETCEVMVNLDVGGCEYLYMILKLHSATCSIAKPTYCSEVVSLLKCLR